MKQNWKLLFELFNQKIESLLKTYYPKTIVSNTKLKETRKPWMTKALLKSIKVKNITDPYEKTDIRKRFKVYRNHVVTLSRICKGNYCNKYFEDNRKNARKLWSEIRSIINVKNKKIQNNSLTIDSKTVTSSSTRANHFNKLFTSLADKLLQKIPKTGKRFKYFLNFHNENSFFISPTDPEEAQDLIMLMELDKAVGPSSIPTRILKYFKKQLSIPLSQLINLSFNKGIFRISLKLAKVIRIHKKGDNKDSNNYRPISLLSNLSKMFEKLIHKRLYSFLHQDDCLFTYQFGFRNHHSMNHALISIIEKIGKFLMKISLPVVFFWTSRKQWIQSTTENY